MDKKVVAAIVLIIVSTGAFLALGGTDQHGEYHTPGVYVDSVFASMLVGTDIELEAEVFPSFMGPAVWSSSDTSVVTCEDGKIVAVGGGVAYVTARCGLFSDSCEVKAVWADVSWIYLSENTLNIQPGQEWKLKYFVSPSNANPAVTWKSSNTSVASVEDGVITAVSEGTATITATGDGGKTATCEVTVGRTSPVGNAALCEEEKRGLSP